jgi:hypothetical protein
MSSINLSGYLSLSWAKSRLIPSALRQGRIRKSLVPSTGLTTPSAEVYSRMIGSFTIGLIPKGPQHRLGSVIRPKLSSFIFPHNLSRETTFLDRCWGLVHPSWQVVLMPVRLLPLHWKGKPGLTFRQLCRPSILDTVNLPAAHPSLCWSAGWIAPISRIGSALAFSGSGVRNYFSGSMDRFSRYRPPFSWFEISR